MQAEEYDSPQSRAQWSSEPAFIFSMAAAAVGLGNIWRFPYMVGENGGGAFILAYLVCVVVVALPLMLLEVGAGRLQQGNVVRTFARVGRAGRAYGWRVVLLTVMITSYYLVITGWTLGYALAAISFSIEPFDDFTDGYNSVWFFLIVTVAAAALLLRGGQPVLDFVDQVGGTNTVIASGVIGAGMFCWLVPRPRIGESLGARSRWWSARVYLVGRTLPFIVAAGLIWRVIG